MKILQQYTHLGLRTTFIWLLIIAEYFARCDGVDDELASTSSITTPRGTSVLSMLLIPLLMIVSYYVYNIYSWYSNVLKVGKEVDKLPGDKAHWLFGNLLQHPGPNEAGLHFQIDYVKRNGGKATRFWFGPFRPVVGLVHPESVKIILRTTEPKGLAGNGPYNLTKPWLGDGLLISSGAKWQRNRKLLTPAFHFDILKPYMEVYDDAANILLNKWSKQLEEHPNESVEIFSGVGLCTLDIILRCAFSYSVDVQNLGKDNPYIKTVMALSWMIVERAFKIIWHIDWLYYLTSHGRRFAASCDYVHKVAEDIIAKRKEILCKPINEVKGRHRDFLDILLLARDEEGAGLTDLEIRNEVDTFLFEGHDTTSSAISWCLYNLAKHPDIQQQAYVELEAQLSGRDSQVLTWNDMSELPFLTMCIKESLRCHPPVPFVVRDLTTPIEIGGVTLLPGTILDVNIYMVHHNEAVWGKDFMEYKPERFHPDNMRMMDSHAFIPFSAGPRNCIGQSFAMHEIKVVVAKVLLRYSFILDSKHKVIVKPELTLRSETGIKLIFTSR